MVGLHFILVYLFSKRHILHQTNKSNLLSRVSVYKVPRLDARYAGRVPRSADWGNQRLQIYARPQLWRSLSAYQRNKH